MPKRREQPPTVALQAALTAAELGLPSYEEVGRDDAGRPRVACVLGGEQVAEGRGANFEEASGVAAGLVLQQLQQLQDSGAQQDTSKRNLTN